MRMTVAGGELYWVNRGTSQLGKQSYGSVRKAGTVAGSPVTVLVDLQYDQPYDLALTATDVYWVNFGAFGLTPLPNGLLPHNGKGALMRVPRAGGAPQTLLASRYGPASIAVDDKRIYWAEWGATVAEGKIFLWAR